MSKAQLQLLAIGVSDYSRVSGCLNLPSASFDSILVSNKYQQQGFTVTLLKDPVETQVVEAIKSLK
jgi:hypothetical protein